MGYRDGGEMKCMDMVARLGVFVTGGGGAAPVVFSPLRVVVCKSAVLHLAAPGGGQPPE